MSLRLGAQPWRSSYTMNEPEGYELLVCLTPLTVHDGFLQSEIHIEWEEKLAAAVNTHHKKGPWGCRTFPSKLASSNGDPLAKIPRP